MIKQLDSASLELLHSALPSVRACCYLGAVLLAGKKIVPVLIGGSFRTAAFIAKTANKKLSQKWEKSGNDYLHRAQKKLILHISGTVLLGCLGLVSDLLEIPISQQITANKASDQAFGILNFFGSTSQTVLQKNSNPTLDEINRYLSYISLVHK